MMSGFRTGPIPLTNGAQTICFSCMPDIISLFEKGSNSGMRDRNPLSKGESRQSKATTRRRQILRALRDLIISKGYAATTVSDIAEAAGISVSHLLYYFRDKEAVLEELSGRLSSRFLRVITSDVEGRAAERLMRLVDHMFSEDDLPDVSHRLTMELIALSMHRARLHENISEFNRALTEHIAELFHQMPRPSGISAEDAAELARAVLTGLANNVLFNSGWNRDRARRIFQLAISDIIGAKR